MEGKCDQLSEFLKAICKDGRLDRLEASLRQSMELLERGFKCGQSHDPSPGPHKNSL